MRPLPRLSGSLTGPVVVRRKEWCWLGEVFLTATGRNQGATLYLIVACHRLSKFLLFFLAMCIIETMESFLHGSGLSHPEYSMRGEGEGPAPKLLEK